MQSGIFSLTASNNVQYFLLLLIPEWSVLVQYSDKPIFPFFLVFVFLFKVSLKHHLKAFMDQIYLVALFGSFVRWTDWLY